MSRALAVSEDRVAVRPGAELLDHLPLTLRTPAAAWTDAAIVNLDFTTSEVIEATVHVQAGSISLATAAVGLGTVHDETVVGATDDPTRVPLLAPESPACLLVRTGPDSIPATAAFHFVVRRPLSAGERAFAPDTRVAPSPEWSRYYGTLGLTLPERLRRRTYQELTAPERMSWVEGLTVVIHPGQQASRAVYISGLYEPNTAFTIKRLLPRGGAFVDVGANVGFFSVLASRWAGPAGRVYSFEPSPRERTHLEQHVRINDLRNVTVVPAAVGDRSGDIVLRLAPEEYGGLNTTGIDFAYPGVPLSSEVVVPLTTLDAWAIEAGIDRIDVIKIDVEGGEVAVLRGALDVIRRRRPAIVFELFSRSLAHHQATIGDVEAFFKPLDYKLFRIDDATAELIAVADLASLDEQNVVALPVR
jgi:FkbM family methyltransferase